jgi:hypothetical protein
MLKHILASVGANRTNRSDDVKIVQALLNKVPSGKGGPSPALEVDGLAWAKTINAITCPSTSRSRFRSSGRFVVRRWFSTSPST